MIKTVFLPAAMLFLVFSLLPLRAQSDFYSIIKDSLSYTDSAGNKLITVYYEYPVFTEKYSKTFGLLNDAVNLMYRTAGLQKAFDYLVQDYKTQSSDNPGFNEIWREEFVLSVKNIDGDHVLLFSRNSKMTGNYYWEDLGWTNFLPDGSYLALASLFDENGIGVLNKIGEKYFRKTYLNGDPKKDISSAGINFSEGNYSIPLEFSFTDKEMIFYHETSTPEVKISEIAIPYSELKGLIKPGTFVDKFIN